MDSCDCEAISGRSGPWRDAVKHFFRISRWVHFNSECVISQMLPSVLHVNIITYIPNSG